MFFGKRLARHGVLIAMFMILSLFLAACAENGAQPLVMTQVVEINATPTPALNVCFTSPSGSQVPAWYALENDIL